MKRNEEMTRAESYESKCTAVFAFPDGWLGPKSVVFSGTTLWIRLD